MVSSLCFQIGFNLHPYTAGVFAIAMVALLFSGWAVVFAQSFVQLPGEETGIGKCDMPRHIAYIHIPKTVWGGRGIVRGTPGGITSPWVSRGTALS